MFVIFIRSLHNENDDALHNENDDALHNENDDYIMRTITLTSMKGQCTYHWQQPGFS